MISSESELVKLSKVINPHLAKGCVEKWLLEVPLTFFTIIVSSNILAPVLIFLSNQNLFCLCQCRYLITVSPETIGIAVPKAKLKMVIADSLTPEL